MICDGIIIHQYMINQVLAIIIKERISCQII